MGFEVFAHLYEGIVDLPLMGWSTKLAEPA